MMLEFCSILQKVFVESKNVCKGQILIIYFFFLLTLSSKDIMLSISLLELFLLESVRS